MDGNYAEKIKVENTSRDEKIGACIVTARSNHAIKWEMFHYRHERKSMEYLFSKINFIDTWGPIITKKFQFLTSFRVQKL